MKSAILAQVCLLVLLTKRIVGQSPFTNSDKECRTMLPSKRAYIPREDKNLFHVHVSDTIYYEKMHHIQVSISNRTSLQIIGVLLQPRLHGCDGPDVDHNVGDFELPPRNDYFEFLNCRGNPKGTVVTKQWTGKPYEGNIEVNFIISNTKRKIKFRATIIGQDGTLYVNNDSGEIRYVSETGADPSEAEECPKKIYSQQFAFKIRDNGAGSGFTNTHITSTLFLFVFSCFIIL